MNATQVDLSRPAARSRRRAGLRQSLVGRMGELLERIEETSSNAERIRQMRQAYFADVDALQRAGTVKLPE